MTSRAQFLGLPLDLLTMDETVDRCRELIDHCQPAQHVVINAGKVVMTRDIPRLQEVIRGCALVSADGQSIVWGGRFLGIPVPERVTGIDLMERLLGLAEAEGYPVFFLGAAQHVLDLFVAQVRSRFPGLVIAGARNGYFADEHRVVDDIRLSGARLLVVGVSSPLKEFFLADNLVAMGALLAVGVGGSFDIWAGKTKRAPKWMQRAGLEWFYRLIQEPRRMWKRYLVGNTRFIRLLMTERFGRRRS
jgi:N-acetylglucosaminyldiphosphoundecaprenol N-acetyl-beta-D-mannosaminyltransferase